MVESANSWPITIILHQIQYSYNVLNDITNRGMAVTQEMAVTQGIAVTQEMAETKLFITCGQTPLPVLCSVHIVCNILYM